MSGMNLPTVSLSRSLPCSTSIIIDVAVATLVAGVMLVALIGNGIGSPLHVLAIVLLLSPVWMLALGGVLLLHSRPSRPEDRSARQLPPGPPGAG